MKPYKSQLKPRRFSMWATAYSDNLVTPENEEEYPCRTTHMDCCQKVALQFKAAQKASDPYQDEDQTTTSVEKFNIMDPLPAAVSLVKFFRKDSHSYEECYPKLLNWKGTRIGGDISPERLATEDDAPPKTNRDGRSKLLDSTLHMLNPAKWNQNFLYLKDVLLHTTGGDSHRKGGGKANRRQLQHRGVKHLLKHFRYPFNKAVHHQCPAEPQRTPRIDHRDSSKVSSSLVALPTEAGSKHATGRNRLQLLTGDMQEMNPECPSRRQQMDRNILESNLDLVARRNSYQVERGQLVVQGELSSSRRHSYQPNMMWKRAPKRTSVQRDRNPPEFGYDRPTRRNCNQFERNWTDFNFDRYSKGGSSGTQADVTPLPGGAERNPRRNGKQTDFVLPKCHPNRQGYRTGNHQTDDTFRQYCGSDPSVALRESVVLVDKGFRNYDKSRWEVMAGSKPPAKQAAGPPRPRQKDILSTDKNTKLNIPKRTSRWETMNIDKLHEAPPSHPVKQEPKGPVPKKAIFKTEVQWDHMDRSMQIFPCEQEPIYRKRIYPQYNNPANRTERSNCTRLDGGPPKPASGQWQVPIKPVAKIAGGDSRWETVRLYDTPNMTQNQALMSVSLQPGRQPTSRVIGESAAHREVILMNHPPNSMPLACLQQGKYPQHNPSHIPTSIGKITPRPIAPRDCLPSPSSSVPISPMLRESRAGRTHTQKEVIHMDSPIKSIGANSAVSSLNRQIAGTVFSANEERQSHHRGVVGLPHRVPSSRGRHRQLEADCEVVAMETGMQQRSYIGEANLAEESISGEPSM